MSSAPAKVGATRTLRLAIRERDNSVSVEDTKYRKTRFYCPQCGAQELWKNSTVQSNDTLYLLCADCAAVVDLPTVPVSWFDDDVVQALVPAAKSRRGVARKMVDTVRIDFEAVETILPAFSARVPAEWA